MGDCVLHRMEHVCVLMFSNNARGNSSVAKALACKHEDLSSDPQHPHEKPDTVQSTCNPSAGEVETEES